MADRPQFHKDMTVRDWLSASALIFSLTTFYVLGGVFFGGY